MTLLEMIQHIGLEPRKVSNTHGGEYHSACPQCGGQDRFFTQPHRRMQKCYGSYCCRQCGTNGDTIQFARDFLNYSFQEAAQAVQDVNDTANDNTLQSNTCMSLSHSTKQFRPKRVHKPNREWIMQATALANRTHHKLLRASDVIDYLIARGISMETIQVYKIGWLPQTMQPTRKSWGLQPENHRSHLWIPEGMIIPYFNNDNVTGIKVRRWNATQRKYVIVSGSMNGMQIIGDRNNTMVIVVESELDALAIYSTVGDFATAIATGSSKAYPDNVTDHLVKKTPLVCICHDNDQAGEQMLVRWQQIYPHAIDASSPMHKDIGEAIQGGINIRNWFSEIYRNSMKT